MHKRTLITEAIVVILVLIGGWLWYASRQGTPVPQQNAPQPATTTQPVAAQLGSDLYPLYNGAQWGPAVATTSPDFGPVSEVQATAATSTMNISAAVTPFTKYYDQKLSQAGWTRDMAREASGPGSNISVYTKGDQFVVVMFSSVFSVHSPNAPVQCPCAVQLTLMSGTTTPRS